MSDKCEVSVSSDDGWNYSACGRPFKTDEQSSERLCGIHLAAKKKREKNDEERRIKEERNGAAEKRARRLCDELEEKWNIKATPYYNSMKSCYNGDVVVDPAAIVALLEAGW